MMESMMAAGRISYEYKWRKEIMQVTPVTFLSTRADAHSFVGWFESVRGSKIKESA